MYLCYLDESGTPEVPGTNSHYVLAGLAIPVWRWRDCTADIQRLKGKFGLAGAEIHTGWIARQYHEQTKIQGFQSMSYANRRLEVMKFRNKRLIQLRGGGDRPRLKKTEKSFSHTEPYIHLTLEERNDFLRQTAELIGNWNYARLFAECIDKIHFDPSRGQYEIEEQAFDQVVSRFEAFLKIRNKTKDEGADKLFGLLIHDNNRTTAPKLTDLMKHFLKKGTLWHRIDHIIETPLFVDSELTGIIQIADLCAYAIRRYVENGETGLFDPILKRGDRKGEIVVGMRHFTTADCKCKICNAHRRVARQLTLPTK